MNRGGASLALCLAMMACAAHGHDHRHATAAKPALQKSFGRPGDQAKVTRTIRMTMSDAMRFAPDRITIRQGDTIRFIIANQGALLHEFVIGTKEELREHAAMMKKFPDMEHDEANMAHVQPGKSETLVWHFNRPGEFQFACLVAGHFEAGMTGTIIVAARSGRNQ